MYFSIIVPVYNVERYLERCVQSVVNQKSEYDCEIILIDDGSKDRSGAMCDELAGQYKNTKVIHKENSGLSDARNVGIDNASGEYIILLDSDDFLEEDVLEELGTFVSKTQPDILYCDIKVIRENSVSKIYKKGLEQNKNYSGLEALKTELRNGKFQAMAQQGIYNREFLNKNNLRFKRGILHEDEEWMPRVELKANKITYEPISFYGYVIRDGSITQKKDKTKNCSDLVDTCYSLTGLIKKEKDKELIKLMNSYFAKLYMGTVAECLINGDIKKIKHKLSRKFIVGKSTSLKDFVKHVIFLISPNSYAKLLNKENQRQRSR